MYNNRKSEIGALILNNMQRTFCDLCGRQGAIKTTFKTYYKLETVFDPCYENDLCEKCLENIFSELKIKKVDI